ncbi:MAG: sugar-transfer associated ATP-grasp domain-containing protein [Roseovarius sp.]
MSDAVSQGALLAAPARPKPPTSQLIVDVARNYGISPLRQFGELMRLCAGWRNMDFHEYYSNQVYRADLSTAEKMTYVGERGSMRLNLRMSPFAATQLRPFVRDKVLYGSVMTHLGFPVPLIQAVFSTERSYGNLATLGSVEQIEAFMTQDAVYPLFVKPEEGSGSVGSALILEFDQTARKLVLSNGKQIDLHSFAAEVAENYGEGFLFQTAVRQHETLNRVAGQAVGSIRVVTVHDGGTPSCLYALWKIPSPDAMSDNYWQPGSMLAEIDPVNGRLLQCRRGSGPDQELLEKHPVSEAVFAELQIPHWEALLDLTSRAHAMLPNFGVIGWDIAITDDGPLIIESNANPHHMLYQLATGRGVLNAEFEAVFERVAKRAKAHVKFLKRKAMSKR